MRPENRVRPLPYAISVRHAVAVPRFSSRIKRLYGVRGREGVGGKIRASLLFAALVLCGYSLPAQGAARARRTLFGDVAVELRSPDRGTLSIGVADARNSLTLDVRATDARRWSETATRLIDAVARAERVRAQRTRAAERTKNSKKKASAGENTPVADARTDTTSRERAMLEEPGIGAGSLVLSRADSAGVTRWLLFASDAELTQVRQLLEPDEARTLARIVRAAAIAAAPAPMRARQKRKASAPKPKASPGRAPSNGLR